MAYLHLLAEAAIKVWAGALLPGSLGLWPGIQVQMGWWTEASASCFRF